MTFCDLLLGFSGLAILALAFSVAINVRLLRLIHRQRRMHDEYGAMLQSLMNELEQR